MLDSCGYSKFEEFDVPIDPSGFLPATGLLYVTSFILYTC
jgi:hypothetical protein